MIFRKAKTEIANEGGRVRVRGRVNAETAAAVLDVVAANKWSAVRIRKGGTPADKVALMLAALERGIEPVVDAKDKALLAQVRTLHQRGERARDLAARAPRATPERTGEIALDPTEHRNEQGDPNRAAPDAPATSPPTGPPLPVATDIVGDQLRAVSKQRSTFTFRSLEKELAKFATTPEQKAELLLAAREHPELKELGYDTYGHMRFTTQRIFAMETTLLEDAIAMAQQRVPVDGRIRDQIIAENPTLSDEQKEQFIKLTQGYKLMTLEGVAGGGKSFLMRLVRDFWERNGRGVDGSALAGVAADGLANESGIEDSRTNEQWKVYFQRRPALEDRVLIDDEVGMAGTEDVDALMRKWGVVVLVGDSRQLQPISFGAPFRAIIERLPDENRARIAGVRRQKIEWQAEATQLFFNGKPREALECYDKHDRFMRHKTLDVAKEKIVQSWAEYTAQHPDCFDADKGVLVLTYTRANVLDMNQRMQAVRRGRGELQGPNVEFQMDDGPRSFAVNDRVRFTAPYTPMVNGRAQKELAVRNGTPAVVTALDAEKKTMTLQLPSQENREVEIAIDTFSKIDFGYCQTDHTAQGKTVDRAWFLATAEKGMGMDLAYVGMSRHRQDCELHYSDDQFKSRSQLYRVLTRFVPKDTSIDYSREAAHMGLGVPNQGPNDVAIRAPYQIRTELLNVVRTASHLRDTAPQEQRDQAQRAYSSVREWYYSVDRKLRDLEARDVRAVTITGSAEELTDRMNLLTTSVDKAVQRAIDLERGTVHDRMADLRNDVDRLRDDVAQRIAEARQKIAAAPVTALSPPDQAIADELARLTAAVAAARVTPSEEATMAELEAQATRRDSTGAEARQTLATIREDIQLRQSAAAAQLADARARFTDPATRQAMQSAYEQRVSAMESQISDRETTEALLAQYERQDAELATVQQQIETLRARDDLSHAELDRIAVELTSGAREEEPEVAR